MLEVQHRVRVADGRQSRPFASSGVDGQAILSPGMWANDDSGFCEWNGPPEKPPPDGQRTTNGTGVPTR